MSYVHLTHEDRVVLALLRRLGHSLRYIARELKKNPSTISRELARNRKQNKSGYDARHARRLTHERTVSAHARRRKLQTDTQLRWHVIRMLRRYWSPEQIAGRLRRQGIIICHETIYRFVYEERPDLKQFLRSQKGKYRRRHGSNQRKRGREELKRRIDQRPQEVTERSRIGDWEGDTVLGKEKTVRILTHVERKSGLLLADKICDAKASIVRAAAVGRLKTVKRHTVTYDNGIEFAEYEMIERDAKITVYFAHPYHSWERGTNENTNGLLRQFFPKKTAFARITQKQIDDAVSLINNRPRKRHGYRTPREIFQECCTSI